MTPDAADQRHQLYVQWLNAGRQRSRHPPARRRSGRRSSPPPAGSCRSTASAPTPPPSFPRPSPPTAGADSLYALPWFVDVGMLYWRTDLMPAPPATFAELVREAQRARRRRGAALRAGLAGRALRGTGHHLPRVSRRATAARILDGGRVVVDSRGGRPGARPRCGTRSTATASCRTAVLTWHEEETPVRLPERRGGVHAELALRLRADAGQRAVAGGGPLRGGADARRARAARPPRRSAARSSPSTRNSEHPEAAWAVIEYLTRPEQMLERARVVGQFPTRPALYDDPELAAALSIPPAQARRGHRARRAPAGHTGLHPALRDPADPPPPRAHPADRAGGRAAPRPQAEMQRAARPGRAWAPGERALPAR